MKPEDLKKLIDGKRRWTQPLTPEEKAKGFKGWYSSKYLPHFDSPGAQQYITYRLADSLPAERRGEWEAILAIEDDLEKQRRLERYLNLGHGVCKAGLACVAAEWPWSSAHYRTQEGTSQKTLTHPTANRVPNMPL